MPDGEVFTGPVEDSVNGEMRSLTRRVTGPRGGRRRVHFENGKVVDASAEKGEDLLLQLLDIDDGARFLGEFAFGTNFDIAEFTKQSCSTRRSAAPFTWHRDAYPETGGTNSSAVHWDMVCDLRDGGSLTVDGEELQRDGRFLVV